MIDNNITFKLFNILTSYGDQYRLNVNENPLHIIEKIKSFENNWSQYNPRKNINRWGLSITNLDGKLGPGPDLDSLYEYNKENKTNYSELDFDVPTPVYDIVSKYCNPFKKWLFRTHILKLGPGGFFPNHIDNIGDNIKSFRILVPLQTCNPTDGGYFVYENHRLLYWQYGYAYFLNTCKQHTVFNASTENDHLVIVMNVKLTNESIKKVTNLILP